MRILLINYAYFKIGGPETYMFNVKALLESHGHEVIPFSLNFTKNTASEYSDYFAESPAGPDTFFYGDMKKTPGLVVKMLARQFYSPHVYRKLKKLIKDTQPDVAYVLHFLKRLSPSIIDACHSSDVPVVVRLSDFGLICGNHILFRDEKVCTLCADDQRNGLKYRCVKNSLFASSIRYYSHRFHEGRGVFHKIDSLVCPSKYMAEVFGGNKHFGTLNVNHLPTFIDPSPYSSMTGFSYEERMKNPTVVYFGRLDYDKGVDLLIDAAVELRRGGFDLGFKLIGESSDPKYEKALRSKIEIERLHNIEIIRFIEKEDLFDTIQRSLVTVLPSRWIDNMPNSLIESQSLGIPVVASNFGSFPELIQEGYNGTLFDPDSVLSLAEKIGEMISDEDKWTLMHKNAQAWVRDYCSPTKHYENLFDIFSSAINRSKQRVRR